MNFLGNLWNGITSAVGSAGSALQSAFGQAYQNLTAPIGGPNAANQYLADAASTIGNLTGLAPKATAPTIVPAGTSVISAPGEVNYPVAPQSYANQTNRPLTTLQAGPTGAGSVTTYTPGGSSPTKSPISAPSSTPKSTAPTPPSVSVGGYSFTPSMPAPTGYGWTNKGTTYVLPTAQSGSSGSGTSIPGGGGGTFTPSSGLSGNPGSGTSASLGAGSAVQGGSQTGTVADSNDQNQNKKQTQTTPTSGSSAPAYIPYTGFGAPPGLKQTTTPQGGTAWQDAGGNIYTQDAGGFTLRTSLPGSNGPMLSTADATGKQIQVPLTAAPQMTFSGQTAGGQQVNGGQVFYVQGTDGNGNPQMQYYVYTPQGYQMVSNPNMVGGQTTGNLTGTLGPVDKNVQVSATPVGNVPVGPQAQQNGSQTSVNTTSLPNFSAGGASDTTSLSGAVASGSDTIGNIQSAIQNGSLNPQTAQQFEQQLTALQASITHAMNSQSGVDSTASYTLDPNEVANGNPGVLGAITSDPSNFQAMNAQFGVPQLMQQYVNSLNTANGITAAVSKITTQIMMDQNMPAGLAASQIAFLGNKASIMLAPIQAQASTIKAQLDYAKSQMSLYYSTYFRGQNLAMSQFNMALANNAIDPTDSGAVTTWAQQLGLNPGQVQNMVTFKNLINVLSAQRTQVGITSTQIQNEANQTIMALLKDPTTVGSVVSGLQNGTFAPTDLSYLPNTGPGAALKSLIVTGATNQGINLEAAGANASLLSNAGVQKQIAALNNVQTLIPQMIKMSDATPRGAAALNSWLIPGGIMVGNVQYNNYKQAALAFADELSGALGFGSATDMSKQMGIDMSNWTQSPAQMKSDLNNVVKPFLQSKLDAQMKILGPAGTSMWGGAAPAAGSSSAAPAGGSSNPAVTSNNPLGL